MTEALCVCCAVFWPKGQPRKPNTPQVCDSCRRRLATDLAAIPEAYSFVDPDPVRGVTEIRSRVFESKPPLNINALSLLGPGSDTPPAKLYFWTHDWALLLEHDQPDPYVTTMSAWLTVRLSWACDLHPAVDEFARDIRELAGELRAYGGKERGEAVGRCPRDRGGERCNTQLFVDPYVDEIECSRCHMKWKRKAGEWMHLRAQQLAAGVEAA